MPGGLAYAEVESEAALFGALAELIRKVDPDILLGFEIQNASWGYVLERAGHLNIPFDRLLSRCPGHKSMLESRPDEYGQQHSSGVHICGREILNLWRICRQEIKLSMYTYCNLCAKVLNRRVPRYSFSNLHSWFEGSEPSGVPPASARLQAPHRCQVLLYYIERAAANIAILDAMEIIGRTCEMARVFGIDFFSVLSRGSQYRVESMLYRLSRTQDYVLISSSVQQRQQQPAMECIPLVMEPKSAYYTDPVCVLDFRSLYPSMVPRQKGHQSFPALVAARGLSFSAA